MKNYQIQKEVYQDKLVAMLFAEEKIKNHTELKFLQLLIKYSDRGFIIMKEHYKKIQIELKLSKSQMSMQLYKLHHENHVKNESGCVYIHPKYKAVKECEGNFLISAK